MNEIRELRREIKDLKAIIQVLCPHKKYRFIREDKLQMVYKCELCDSYFYKNKIGKMN